MRAGKRKMKGNGTNSEFNLLQEENLRLKQENRILRQQTGMLRKSIGRFSTRCVS
jgi:hypothetical protein